MLKASLSKHPYSKKPSLPYENPDHTPVYSFHSWQTNWLSCHVNIVPDRFLLHFKNLSDIVWSVLYSKKNKQIHIMWLSYYSNKSIFFKADCVRLKHEKHSQNSRENCRVRTIWICQGKYNSTYLTTTFIHFDYKILKYVWTPRFSFAWKIKSMVFLTTFSSSCH